MTLRRLDLLLAAVRLLGVVLLAARLVGPLAAGEPLRQTSLDVALLLGAVVAPTLLRRLVLWPRLFDVSSLPQDTWWRRYRGLVVSLGLRAPLVEVLSSGLAVVVLSIPIFLLQQSIGFGSPTGEWAAAGFGAWLRSLVKTSLAVGISAAVWWAALACVVHLTWALLALQTRPRTGAATLALRIAQVAWVAAPLGLLLTRG
ncbi:MAG: hypothetical protein ACOZQL_18915 [Myxococcota bacterium]